MLEYKTLGVISLLCCFAQSQVTTLSVSANSITTQSLPIDASFPGFAFEQASFYNYAFDSSGNPNTFSQNLINQVLNRTGGTPILRVGGTSGDKAAYVASQTAPVNYPATTYPPEEGSTQLTLGPSYFKSFSNFPGAKFIFMVPLYHRNLSNTVEWAKYGLNKIGSNLQAVEIGNEPNAYPWFTVQAYVDEYNKFLNGLMTQIPSLKNKQIFQALDTASGNIGALTAPAAYGAGLEAQYVNEVAMHRYQGSDEDDGLAGLQLRIANHTAIAEGLAAYIPSIQYVHQNHPDTLFVLSEVGNTLGKGDPEQRNNLATCLWNVDFQLYSMSINVSRVNMQNIVSPGYEMWEPVAYVGGSAAVRANYYSQPFIADFIGSGTSPTVSLFAGATAKLVAYGASETGALARVAVVNFDLWDGTGARPLVQYTITDLPASVTAATVSYLTAPDGAYANTTITWSGLQWTAASDGLPKPKSQASFPLTVSKGTVTVPVNATSAALVTFS